MDDVLKTGKLPAALLRSLLESGAPRPPDLLLPPAIGEDAAAVRMGAETIVVASDPVTLTGHDVGAHAVIVNANDIAVMGARPRWYVATVLLPAGTREGEIRRLFESMHAALARLDAVLVGGHTEVTEAVTRTVVVGQMMGLCPGGRFVRTGGVRPDHVVLQVGPALLEGAAVLASDAADKLRGLPAELLARARYALHEPGISVVTPALEAAELGASAMHDPTEGGLSAALHEMAEASSLRLRVEPEAVLWFEPGRALCEALGLDPWGLLASGTLLVAFPPEAAAEAQRALAAAGHAVAAIARAEPGAGVVFSDGRPLRRYERDETVRALSG